MSYQERRAVVGLIGTVVIAGGYAAWMLPRYPGGDTYAPAIWQYWGAYFLILIVVSIIVRIILAILFSIGNAIATRELEAGLQDERDHLIELKSTRNGLFVFIAGFMLAMLALVAGQTPTTMFIIILLAGVASELFSYISQFWFYRNGIQ